MSDIISAWYAFLLLQVLLVSLVVLYTKDLRFFSLVLFGALVGSVFDHSAISLGFYSYNKAMDPVLIGEVPFTISLAEGMGMSLVIFAFELISKKLRLKL